MGMPKPSTDTAAVVTGASGGIGAGIARELAARGYQVVLVARSADKLQRLADEVSAGGVRAEVLAADLSDRGQRAALLGRITELGLVPTVLVNNAGLSTLGPVHKSNPDAELNMIEVDVVAVADLCSRFLPGMVERGSGAVLNVASTAAFQPLPGQAAYAAGKAFVLSYTQSLAGELHGTGVTATALCPGPVETGFADAAGIENFDSALPRVLYQSVAAVAKTAVDGLARGQLVAIPGFANRATAAVSQVTPRSLLLPILRRNHPGLK